MKKTFNEEHLPELIDFVKKHAPKVPDFIAENLPKFNPQQGALGPATASRKDPTLLEAYFGGDVSHLQADALSRPDHYTEMQKDILRTLELKKPLPPGATVADINDIVLRFTERTEQRKKREDVVRSAQKKLGDDPTVDRVAAEEKEREERRMAEETWEKQQFPKSIKII